MPKRGEKLTLQERLRRENMLSQESINKRRRNLEIGQHIRAICCIDAMARRFHSRDNHDIIRSVCDKEMHIIGYESLTEHKERIDKALEDNSYLDRPNKWFRYQRQT